VIAFGDNTNDGSLYVYSLNRVYSINTQRGTGVVIAGSSFSGIVDGTESVGKFAGVTEMVYCAFKTLCVLDMGQIRVIYIETKTVTTAASVAYRTDIASMGAVLGGSFVVYSHPTAIDFVDFDQVLLMLLLDSSTNMKMLTNSTNVKMLTNSTNVKMLTNSSKPPKGVHPQPLEHRRATEQNRHPGRIHHGNNRSLRLRADRHRLPGWSLCVRAAHVPVWLGVAGGSPLCRDAVRAQACVQRPRNFLLLESRHVCLHAVVLPRRGLEELCSVSAWLLVRGRKLR
jgi:hypothetical protein